MLFWQKYVEDYVNTTQAFCVLHVSSSVYLNDPAMQLQHTY